VRGLVNYKMQNRLFLYKTVSMNNDFYTEANLFSERHTILYHCLGRRKIHFLFSDGTEMCEEYDLESNLLLGK